MNAKEQMKALLDKKIIVCEGSCYKLNDKGNLVVCYGPVEDGEWGENTCPDFFFEDANYIYDESKWVDFAHALGMMAEGKVMRCLWSNECYRIFDGALQSFYRKEWTTVEQGETLEENEMESMWVEVE